VSRLVVIVAAAALLPPAAFAALAFTLALTDLVRGGLLAFDVEAIRLLSGRRQGREDVLRASLDAKTLAGGVALLVVTALAALIDGVITAWMVVVSGVGTLGASYGASFLVQRQAALALHSRSVQVMIAGFVGTALALVWVWWASTAIGILAGLAIGDLLLLVLVGAGHRWQAPDWRQSAAWIHRTRGLMVMQLAHIGQFRAGTIVLTAFGSTVAVAEYTIASRMTEGLVILAAALSSSSLPLMGAAHAQDRPVGVADVFDRSYGLGTRLVAPLLALVVLAAPFWIPVLFPRYPDVGPTTAVVGLSVLLYFASSQTTALLNATNHDAAATRSAVTGLLASLVGSLGVVPLGAVGVAWARVTGEGLRLLVEATTAIRKLRIGPALLVRPWVAIAPVIAGAGMAVAWHWQPPYIWIATAVVVAGTLELIVRLRQAPARPT
jgi:O-antigen/teichoic acid export membrane protein